MQYSYSPSFSVDSVFSAKQLICLLEVYIRGVLVEQSEAVVWQLWARNLAISAHRPLLGAILTETEADKHAATDACRMPFSLSHAEFIRVLPGEPSS